MNAVDTNVLIYSINQREPVKQMKAQQTLNALSIATTPTVLPWQALGESVQCLRRWLDRGEISKAEFDHHLAEFRGLFPYVMPTIGVLDFALDLASRYSLSHWDSMLLGACRESGVTTLYTEDIGAPRTIDGIQLINPFV